MPVAITIPEGIKRFLDEFEEIRNEPLPTSVKVIILNGQIEACLGHNMTSAEQIYMYNLLKGKEFLDKTPLGFDKFNEALIKFLEKEKRQEDDNKKKHAVSLMLSDIDNMVQGLLGVPEFVKNRSLNIEKLKEVRKDEKLAWKLFEDICHSEDGIRGFGAVKTTIWMHSIGVCETLPTPSSHVKWLLKKYFPYVITYAYNEIIPDSEAMAYTKSYVKIMNDKLGMSCSEGVFTNAIWVWKNCINAMPQYSNRLTPDKLMDFMKANKYDLEDIRSMIIDLDEIDELGKELTDFV